MVQYSKIKFKDLSDLRGGLVAIEGGEMLPFDINRIYYIFGTKSGVSRGYHAHKKLKQIVICLHGNCRFLVDDGVRKDSIELHSPKEGIYIEGMVWREMHDFSEDCVLLVLASEMYDESDYIRDYEQFIEKVNYGKI